MKIAQLLKFIKSIWNTEFILITKDKVVTNIHTNNKIDVYSNAITSLNEQIVNDLGQTVVQDNLEVLNNEMFNIYKEIDYQLCRADYLEAELLYNKEVNNPLGGDANKLYILYKKYMDLKKKYENFM